MDASARVDPQRTLFIVLPAYNEAENLPRQLETLRETMTATRDHYRVIVVDDGSRDATAQVAETFAEAMPLTLVRHPVNQGLGAALRDGLAEALDQAGESDIVVTMDADDTQTSVLIDQMVQRIDAGCDVVIASRYRPGSRVVGVPLVRRVLSRGASWLMRAVLPIHGVRDFTCGCRAYRVTVLRRAIAHYGGELITQDGFQCMVDILLRLRPLGVTFGEVPLLLRYDRKSGKSKMAVGRTTWNTLRLLARRRLGY
jgi:dolichol-phosphate mannosyltransferase